ncbi:zinc finger protein 845-like [Galleria mellonella]|uniref:Zinc finger protein 845-like n=1 Tax=Galleria mellonella TaxID=7137 RepID=A0ABM3N0P5_GALME|nr:zinc finger protein 845-like [Galleria mellonella]
MNNLVLNKNRKAVNLTNKNAVTMKREELDKHIFNLSEILKCSNATPIRNHDGIGYGCSYCNEIFIKPEQLKTHTINDHADVATTSFMKRKCLSEFFVKLDITNLHCKMCGKPASSYEDLMDHLHSEHGKGVHFDIKNQILPFKFENETLRCYICLNNFAKFKALLEHMNSHYRNFVCPICDTGFVNERRLQIHKQIHKSGVFSCGVCTKTYDTLQKRKAHEKCHVQPSGRNKCGICNEAFLCYRRKQRHLLEVHGIKPVELKCQACDKVFSDRRAFTVHTKRDHLMERRHHCTECDMKFFKSSELTHHMLKHTGERHFQCDLCLKSYGRKTTLAEHMRIHNNDRRFKCEYCGQAFVQKCSWKGSPREAIIKKERKPKNNVSVKSIRSRKVKKETEALKNEGHSLIGNATNENEIDKHILNIKAILKNSNATLIRAHGDVGYKCYFCQEQYPNPADLKMHTIDQHDVSTASFARDRRISEFVVKVDITDLRCKICGDNIDNLEDLVKHLKSHQIKMFSDIKNHILPFKFNTDGLKCFLCLNIFAKFKTLQVHMSSSHYKNYMCDLCDAGYVNQRQLANHKTSHDTGTFTCDVCQKVFDTIRKKKLHEKLAHDVKPKFQNRCGHCNDTFKWFHMKEKHLLEVHGIRPVPIKCQACDKIFWHRNKYRTHMKRDHLMERPHKCTECDMTFSTLATLKSHQLKHSSVKNFHCGICLKSYARKKTLREHMRIHNNDRRFKCEHCGQAFVQKCSWKSHIRSKHGELA